MGLHQHEEFPRGVLTGSPSSEEPELFPHQFLKADASTPRQGAEPLEEIIFDGNCHLHAPMIRGHVFRVLPTRIHLVLGVCPQSRCTIPSAHGWKAPGRGQGGVELGEDGVRGAEALIGVTGATIALGLLAGPGP